MKIFTLSFLCTLACCIGLAQPALVKKSLLQQQVEIVVPTTFRVLPASRFTDFYRQTIQPVVVFSDGLEQVRLAVFYTQLAMDDNGIPAYTDELLKELRKNKKGFSLKDDGILLKDGKNIGYIKCVYKEQGQKRFGYFFYTSLNNQLLLFQFDCQRKAQENWEETAANMASTLVINPNNEPQPVTAYNAQNY